MIQLVIGVPGYPVSAYLALEWFVQPFICDYLQIPVPKREKITVKLGRRVVGTMGAEDFIRMSIGYVNGEYIANPLTKGSRGNDVACESRWDASYSVTFT